MNYNLREAMFRLWYWYVNRADKNAEVLFMNFGYSDKQYRVEIDEQCEPNRYPIQLYHHLTNEVEIKNRDIIEIGCGRGGGLHYITRDFLPNSAKGIDINKQAVSFCNRFYNHKGLTFAQGDAQKLPLSDNSCDVLINVESSHRYPRVNEFLKEVTRILRPGGHFLYTDFRYDHEMEEMKRLIKTSGMTIIKEKMINKEVITALELDDLRKRKLIIKLAPGFLHKIAFNFAGVIDSVTYNQFVSNKYVYFSYVLKKEQ